MCYIGTLLLFFGCRKCLKTAKENQDKHVIAKKSPLYEDEYVTVYPASQPSMNVDLLITPKQSIPTLQHVEEQHIPIFGRMLTVAKKLAKENNCTIGYQLLIQDQDSDQAVDGLYMRLQTNKSGRPNPRKKSDTTFMKIVNREAPADIIFQDKWVTAFASNSEKGANGQIRKLIVPNKLIPTVNDVQPEDEDMLGRMFIVAKQIAQQKNFLQNYELYIYCNECKQAVYHLHVHLNSKGKI